MKKNICSFPKNFWLLKNFFLDEITFFIFNNVISVSLFHSNSLSLLLTLSLTHTLSLTQTQTLSLTHSVCLSLFLLHVCATLQDVKQWPYWCFPFKCPSFKKQFLNGQNIPLRIKGEVEEMVGIESGRGDVTKERGGEGCGNNWPVPEKQFCHVLFWPQPPHQVFLFFV